MHGTYSLTLVSLSIVIAMLASYTVLDLTGYISFLERPRLKHAWLAGGAAAMGIGIWSMHFIGMLAFSLPIPLGYDLKITGASLALTVLVSYLALNVVVRPDLTYPRLLIGGILLGGGVAGMHYAGMAAMRMQPGIDYHPALVAASIVIAVAAATAALWIAHRLSAPSRRHVLLKRLGASAVMGLAITGMHYTGMAAADFMPGTICGAARGVNTTWLATTVTMFTLAILAVTLLVSRFDAHTAFLRRMTQTLEAQISRRTGELHGTLHPHQQMTEGLHATGEPQAINGPIHLLMANLTVLKTRIERLTTDVEQQQAYIAEPSSALDGLKGLWQDANMVAACQHIHALVDDSLIAALKVRQIGEDRTDFFHCGKSDAA